MPKPAPPIVKKLPDESVCPLKPDQEAPSSLIKNGENK